MTELELRVDLYSLPDGQYIYHNEDYSRVVRVEKAGLWYFIMDGQKRKIPYTAVSMIARDIDAYMAS